MSIDSFRNYCEGHKNAPSKEESQKHMVLVKRIFENPETIGLRNILLKYKEVVLEENTEKKGKVDLIFLGEEEMYYICEVKSSLKKGRGIESQLKRYYSWIENKFKINPIMIGVQLTETGKLRKHIIPAEIENLLQLAFPKNIEVEK